MTEAALQSYLMIQARAHGVYARKVIAVANTGFPDVFLAGNGMVVLVELKHPNGKGLLSKKQLVEIDKIKSAGVMVFVIDKKEGCDNVIAMLA